MQTVHIRVNDAATGTPTPCRVRFTDATGKYHAPLGRRDQFPNNLTNDAEGNVYDGSEAWAYIDGACEIQLPPGPIAVQIRKGIEFTPLSTTIELPPGKLAMRFTLERWTDWSKKGWYAGDGRVHNGSPHEALLQAAGEDLAVVNLLAEDTEAGTMPNIVAFSGQKPCLEMPGHMVVVNTHNVHPDLGSLGLLNSHRVVYPLRLGREGEDDWTLADWCDQCHRKQGLVVWTDTDRGYPSMTETVADLVLGKIDAFEIVGPVSNRPVCNRPGVVVKAASFDLGSVKAGSFDYGAVSPPHMALWSTLLDAGFHIPLIGSSGARTNGQVIGRPRTYAELGPGEPLTYRNWIEAVRAGRTFVTHGPLLQFTVNGQPPGSVIRLSVNDKTVLVRAEVQSPLPLTRLEILCNDEFADRVDSHGANFPWNIALEKEIPVPEGGCWLAAHCCGPDSVLARTSPIYVQVQGSEPPQRQPARAILARWTAELLKQAQEKRPRNERLVHVLQSACDALLALRRRSGSES